MRLNGWRRISVALFCSWLLGVTAYVTYEVLGHHDGYFVGLQPLVGIMITGNKATLPDGRIVDLNESIGGLPINPWEIKWANVPEIPKEPFIRWSRLFLLGLLLPLCVWLCIEALVLVWHWIARGFREGNVP